MTRWDYLLEHVNVNQNGYSALVTVLRDRGEQGWEAFHVETSQPGVNAIAVYFKRRGPRPEVSA